MVISEFPLHVQNDQKGLQPRQPNFVASTSFEPMRSLITIPTDEQGIFYKGEWAWIITKALIILRIRFRSKLLRKSQVDVHVVIYHWTRNRNSTELSNTCGASKFGLHQFPKLSSTTQSTSVPCSGRPRIWSSINQQVIGIYMYLSISTHPCSCTCTWQQVITAKSILFSSIYACNAYKEQYHYTVM